MNTCDFFLILSVILVAPHISPWLALALSIVYLVLALFSRGKP